MKILHLVELNIHQIEKKKSRLLDYTFIIIIFCLPCNY